MSSSRWGIVPARGVELVFAGVAVAADEIVAARVGDQSG